jgi:hypothetical protein
MSNKLSFDYNNIRKLTSNLKTNLKNKYSSLENITSGINNTDGGNGYQYSSLQVSESDKYIDDLTLLFDTNTLDGNYKVNGNLSVNTLQANNIILNNENDINTIIETIKRQDMKLSKQTINSSELNEITINNSRIYSSIVNDSILNRCTFNNIRNINGQVGINNNTPVYDLDINGSVHISRNIIIDNNVDISNNLYVGNNVDIKGITMMGTDSSGISHIEYGNVTLNVTGTYIITTNPFGINPTILLSYSNVTGPITNILYTSSISSPSFTINGDANKKVSWMLIE